MTTTLGGVLGVSLAGLAWLGPELRDAPLVLAAGLLLGAMSALGLLPISTGDKPDPRTPLPGTAS